MARQRIHRRAYVALLVPMDPVRRIPSIRCDRRHAPYLRQILQPAGCLAHRRIQHQDRVVARPQIAQPRIGANLAVLEGASDPAVASLALLSPSLDYRGLRIEGAARKYGNRPILLVSSDDDGYARRTVVDLQKTGTPRETIQLSGAGHGTNMLGRAPELTDLLVDWFRRTLK